MERECNIWILGGDERQVRLAQLMEKDGHTVHTYALERARNVPSPQLSLERIDRADCVVLPMGVPVGALHAPLSARTCPLADVLIRLSPTQFLCGGRVEDSARQLARQHGLTLHDYFTREELTVANAVPTAEGAIQLAMEHLPITVHGCQVLVLGFGRVGRACAARFSALGARVTVSARSWEALSWAQAMALHTERLENLSHWLCRFDLVVNTVPARVLGAAELSEIRPEALILDLASLPGGVDFAAAAQLGKTAIHALALPGKVAPVTAGAAIKDTIYHMMDELGLSAQKG